VGRGDVPQIPMRASRDVTHFVSTKEVHEEVEPTCCR